ncbi:MAG: penicillin acylase family protein [Bdellovibrionales bacterium]
MKKALFFIFLSTISLWVIAQKLFLNPVPNRTDEIQIPLLESGVEVKYDNFGVPHISAKTQRDAQITLGFIVAQNRLFQMDMQRRVAKGELSEIVGPVALEVDKKNRTMAFRYYAEKHLQNGNISQKALASSQAFFEGVNYFIATQPLPIEFTLLGYKPSDFSVLDSIAFVGYMSFSFQHGINVDPELHNFSFNLDKTKFQELVNSYSNDDDGIDKTKASSKNVNNQKTSAQKKITKIFEDLEIEKYFDFKLEGSNSWVLSSDRSSTGSPILANDPHIGHANPGVWFEAYIETPEYSSYGHYASMIPFPLLAHTPNIAWALTMSNVDDFDLVMAKNSDANTYSLDYKDYDYEIIKDEIPVKDGTAVPHEVKISILGPALTDIIDIDADHDAIADWTFYSKDYSGYQALYELPFANDLEQFKDSLAKLTAPGLNISYVDKAENIAWFAAGWIPRRKRASNGFAMIHGNEYSDHKAGYLDFSEHPQLINPEDGIIVTANHMVSHSRKDLLPGYWQPSDRAEQIIDRLAEKEVWSPEEMKDIALDTTDWAWLKVKDQFLSYLKEIQKTQKIDKLSETIKILETWNSKADIDERGILIFRTYSNYITQEAMQDEMGTRSFNKLFKNAQRWNLYKSILQNPDSTWWDNEKTEEIKETHLDTIAKAIPKAHQLLEKKCGTNVGSWQWKCLHTLELVHPLGRKDPLNFVFNIGPKPVSGGYSIVNHNNSRSIDGFKVTSGPSTRRIISMDKPTISYGILPSGQSGHLMDQHYSDQWKMYREGKFRKQLMTMDHPELGPSQRFNP